MATVGWFSLCKIWAIVCRKSVRTQACFLSTFANDDGARLDAPALISQHQHLRIVVTGAIIVPAPTCRVPRVCQPLSSVLCVIPLGQFLQSLFPRHRQGDWSSKEGKPQSAVGMGGVEPHSSGLRQPGFNFDYHFLFVEPCINYLNSFEFLSKNGIIIVSTS